MECLRRIVDSDILATVFTLPENFRHRRVEILLFPVECQGAVAREHNEHRYVYNGPPARPELAWAESLMEHYDEVNNGHRRRSEPKQELRYVYTGPAAEMEPAWAEILMEYYSC